MRETIAREASFLELVEFVAYKSEVMNSMYGKLVWSTHAIGMEKNVITQRRKPAVLNTVPTNKGHSRRTGRYPMTMCLYCKYIHQLAECKDFQNLLIRRE